MGFLCSNSAQCVHRDDVFTTLFLRDELGDDEKKDERELERRNLGWLFLQYNLGKLGLILFLPFVKKSGLRMEMEWRRADLVKYLSAKKDFFFFVVGNHSARLVISHHIY